MLELERVYKIYSNNYTGYNLGIADNIFNSFIDEFETFNYISTSCEISKITLIEKI